MRTDASLALCAESLSDTAARCASGPQPCSRGSSWRPPRAAALNGPWSAHCCSWETVTWDIRRIEACIRSTRGSAATHPCRSRFTLLDTDNLGYIQVSGHRKAAWAKDGWRWPEVGKLGSPPTSSAKPLSPRTPPPLAPQTHHQTHHCHPHRLQLLPILIQPVAPVVWRCLSVVVNSC